MKAMGWFSVLALGLAACSAGRGVGAASGSIYEYGCNKNGDYCMPDGDGGTAYGTEARPVAYNLKPSYFAGEPIDDLREYSAGSEIMSNRLIIRLQRSGKQLELNDVLTFDVASSYEVARCVRGRVDSTTGANDWDEANCYRASDTGPGRLRVQYDSPVHGSLALKSTCTANIVGSAVSSPVPLSYTTAVAPVVTDGNWDSWVELQEFGSASQTSLAPQARTPISNKFRTDFGERIYASSFFLTLIDDNVVNAAIYSRPKPAPQMGGTLGGDPTTGRFDFDLQRGQGAQFFP
jgi:hypothetical protein